MRVASFLAFLVFPLLCLVWSAVGAQDMTSTFEGVEKMAAKLAAEPFQEPASIDGF